MAIDFPAAPANGATHTAAGAVWQFDGVKWKANSASAPGDITSVTAGTGLSGGGTSGDVSLALATPVSIANGGTGSTTAAAAPFVEIAGDTMSGTLTIKPAAQLVLDKNASGDASQIWGFKAGLGRWNLLLGDATAESGSNLGSDFKLYRFNDAGAIQDAPLSISRASGIVSLSPTGFCVNTGGGVGGLFGVDGLNWSQTTGLIVENVTNAPLALNKRGANGYVQTIYQTGNLCGSITVANGVSTAFNTSSDGRMKEDFRPFDAGPFIDALDVYDFAWKDSDIRGHGVTAQAVEPVYPEAVTHDADTDAWMVDYSKFVPLLLQEVKALRSRLAALEAA